MTPPRVTVLGAGNMGAALIGGMLKAGVVAAENLTATTRSEASAAKLAERFSIVATAGGNRDAARMADIVILAVKPTSIAKVIHEIRDGLRENQLLISLAASLPLAVIESEVRLLMPVFRAMPNIPVVLEEGAIGICHNAIATRAQRDLVESLFRAVGIVAWVEDEQMDAVTALSGSGPAYVYIFIEAMIAAGLKMGLSRDVSARLAEQTVLGAAKHVRDSGLHPAILRDQVITPGGVTIAAIHELERHGLRSMLISAIETATHHSRQRTNALLEQINLPNS
ncbi:MAG: pyrroline-5-carboxylate reductase [Acidobacteria bacterium]|nr:pyrroline-5-carboxylate reductase [Acidobacteriota bacterium]